MSQQGGNHSKQGRYATRVKLISDGENIDALFDALGKSRYDVLAIDHDKVTDVQAMLAYCKSIENRAEQIERGIPPVIVVYYSTGIDWRNFSQTVERYQNFGISTCFEKDGEAKADLESAFVREWEEHDAQHERHMRSLFPGIPEQEGEWPGRLTLNDCVAGTFNFTCDAGTFVLRGGDPQNYLGRPMHWLSVKGKILSERSDAHRVENLLQVLEVAKITGCPLTDDEIRRNIEEMGKGPFLGRLNHPEIFGENPDLYAPMTKEQWDRMLNPEKYGLERVD
jgi:hypothetical protein